MLKAAYTAIDAENAQDPKNEEVVYGNRMTNRLAAFSPDASDVLKLAARAQHIRRWEIVRESFDEGRRGYHDWRNAAMAHHATVVKTVLSGVGYDDEAIGAVQALVTKQKLTTDPEMQVLEDVICIVFLQHYALDFAGKHDEPKLLRILTKTWGKMSGAGRLAALSTDLPLSVRELIAKATTS